MQALVMIWPNCDETQHGCGTGINPGRASGKNGCDGRGDFDRYTARSERWNVVRIYLGSNGEYLMYPAFDLINAKFRSGSDHRTIAFQSTRLGVYLSQMLFGSGCC